MADTRNTKRNRRRAKKRLTPLGLTVRLALAVIIAAAAVIAVKSGMDTSKKVLYPVAYEDLIFKYAEENELDPYFVMGVIKTESNFIPDAHSGYAAGLMQITDETAEWLAKRMELDTSDIDLFDPETSIKIGCYYLRYLIDRYGVTDTALAAYNAGIGNVGKWLENKEYSDDGRTLKSIPFTETRNYVQRVNSSWQYYTEYYDQYRAQQANVQTKS